jgi:AcrR family transcriptional regulator
MLVAEMISRQNTGSDAREQVLHAAERIFALKGYAGTTLRDIAQAVGIRHASLYHHAPGGKEDLFVAVTLRTLQRHRDGLEAALASTPGDIRAQLYASADWLVAQAPMDLLRMVHADMPAIDPVHAERLSRLAYDSLIRPVELALNDAVQGGEIEPIDVGVVAAGLVGMIESLHSAPESALAYAGRSRAQLAHYLIDVLLDGMYNHKGENYYASSAIFSQ